MQLLKQWIQAEKKPQIAALLDESVTLKSI